MTNQFSLELDAARVKKVQQLQLFGPTPVEICEKVGLNWLTALHLSQLGLISFDPAMVSELDLCQEAELEFIGALVAAGCTTQMLRILLKGLQPPYAYKLSRIYYDWGLQSWMLFPISQPDLDNFEDLVDMYQKNEDLPALFRLKWRIEDAIEECSPANRED